MYDRFAESFRKEIEEVCNRLRDRRQKWDHGAPGTLRADDCFLDGPITQARSWTLGSVKYPNIICAISSIASAADCFAVLDELVFRSKKVSLNTLKDALCNDFADEEALRQLCLNAPKFGQDDD